MNDALFDDLLAGMPQPGDVVLGKYRIERVIGRGGMAVVYAAEHEILHQRVAIKLLLPDAAHNEDTIARFMNEARAVARIRNEHVAGVVDVGQMDSGRLYMVLEYLEGQDLAQLLEEHGPLAVTDAVDYVLQALVAISQAHLSGIVHRDLKPGNLFRAKKPDGGWIIKVLDFGISKVLGPVDKELTTTAVMLGSPGYMSPEQVRSSKSVDGRSDIWSIGVILHRLLTDQLPFEGDNVGAILAAILEQKPPGVRSLRSEVPEGLEHAILRCLEQDREARWASASELASALLPFASPDGARTVERISKNPGIPSAPRLTKRDAFTPTPVVVPHDALAETVRSDDAAPPAPPAPASHDESARAPSVTPLGAGEAAHAGPRSRSRARLIAVGGFALVAGVATLVTWRLVASNARDPRAASEAGEASEATKSKGAGAGGTAVARLSLGLSDASCALDTGGAVRCAGARIGPKGGAAGGLKGAATEIAVGKHHACALMQGGSVHCWGENSTGQLGDGTTKTRGAGEVPGLRGVVQIASSIHGSCARLADGGVRCWGGNRYGLIGDGTTIDRLAPVDVAGASGAVALALGQDHACAVLGDGTVRCWGRNADGELGDGSTTDRSIPTRVEGIDTAVGIALGAHYGCVVLRDATVRCWGSNSGGELGTGATARSGSVPALVAGLDEVTQIATGGKHACALRTNGTVRCWGENNFGQIGDGTTSARRVPVAISGTFDRIAAGRDHTCGVRTDGAPLCWGKNEHGQLADGSTTNRLEPTPASRLLNE